ncbi:MAG: hydroxymethylglutaryl-CoA lyase, partial [Armatimonadota bacterium]
FTAASDAFTQRNIKMSVEDSLSLFAKLIADFRNAVPEGFIRGYVSTIVECPFTGSVLPESVTRVVDRLDRMGVDEVSLGETLGVAVPDEIAAVARSVEDVIAPAQIAWHFHDTRGTALANVFAMVERGYRSFDASAGGLGGCPFAPGAGGNLATEDLVYALDRAGYDTGINLDLLARASLPVLETLGVPIRAKAQQATLASACS